MYVYSFSFDIFNTFHVDYMSKNITQKLLGK